jgi:hypothetical protein
VLNDGCVRPSASHDTDAEADETEGQSQRVADADKSLGYHHQFFIVP